MLRGTIRKSSIVAMVIGLVVVLSGCDIWPMFHADPLHSGVSTYNAIGASHAPNMSLRWKTMVNNGAAVESSPSVVYNSTLSKMLVYVGSNASAGNGAIDAIDLATGNIVWSTSVTGYIFSSPTVSGNTVYFGTVIFGPNYGQLVALDATTGALQCSFATNGQVFDSPVVASVDSTGPVVFFGDAGMSLAQNFGHEWAVNGVGNTAGACTQRWSFNSWNNTNSGTMTGSWSSPAFVKDSTGRPLLVLGSSDPDDSVYALDARTGTPVWRFQTAVRGNDADVGAAPTISPPGTNGFSDGVVYIDGKDGIEYAIDLLTGAQIWQFDMKAASGGLAANSSQAAAAFTGDTVVVPYGGTVYSLNPVTGAKNWQSATYGDNFYASPVVSGGTNDRVVLIGDDTGVEHVLRLSDGTALFAFTTARPIYSSVAIVPGGTALFGSNDGYLYALS